MPSTRLFTVDYETGQRHYLDVDTQTWSLLVTTNEHHHIHEGLAWDITGTANLDAGAVYRYTLTTEDSDYLTHLRFHVYGEGEGSVKLFEGPVIDTAGTTVEPVCRNRDNPSAARTIVYHTPTTSADGTQIYYGAFGANRDAGALVANEEWILKRDTEYLFVITSDVAANEVAWEIFWYEHSKYEVH